MVVPIQLIFPVAFLQGGYFIHTGKVTDMSKQLFLQLPIIFLYLSSSRMKYRFPTQELIIHFRIRWFSLEFPMFHYELSSKRRMLLVLQPSVKERKMRSLHFLLCKGLTPPTLFSALYSTQDSGRGDQQGKGRGKLGRAEMPPVFKASQYVLFPAVITFTRWPLILLQINLSSTFSTLNNISLQRS